MPTAPRVVHGADISHHNPQTDFARAKKAGLKFLYHKATEGDSFVDTTYPARRKKAKEAGIPFGAYHFARAEYLKSGPDAVAEARRFVKVADPKPGDLRPALDLETTEGLTPGELRRWARLFCNEVERLTGVKPVLYSPWELSLGLTRWVPRYNDANDPPRVPWDIWQFSNGQFGVPDFHPGLGHVDLNTKRAGFDLGTLIIPPKAPPKPPEPEFTDLKYGHFSLQFSDTKVQKSHDADKIFALGLDMITGTEAGQRELRFQLREAAKREGYYLHFGRGDCWVAVKRSIVKGLPQTGDEFVGPANEGVGHHSIRSVPWISFDTAELGRITVAAGHYLTKGRRPGDPNWKINVRYANIIGDLAMEKGAGRGLFFYGGDQNIVDKISDTFIGAPLTSFWDELEKWQGTAHGNIDVWASFDGDGRSEPLSIRALTGREFPLHSDHFGVRGRVRIKHIRA